MRVGWCVSLLFVACIGTPRGSLGALDAGDEAATADAGRVDVVIPDEDPPPDAPAAATDVVTAPPDVAQRDAPSIDAPSIDIPATLDVPRIDAPVTVDAPADAPVADIPPTDVGGCPAGMFDCGAGCIDTTMNPMACGACGRVCPGQGTGTSTATCAAGICAITCLGDRYDVDGNPANGCEVVDDTLGGHTQAAALSRGSLSCDDTVRDTITGGRIPSDARAHSPSPEGFDRAVGAAPDWYSVVGSGGALCVDNYGVTFTTTGGGDAVCYRCTIVTNRTTDSVMASGRGTVTMSNGGFSLYTTGSTIYLRVEKICSPPTPEDVAYTITYHL